MAKAKRGEHPNSRANLPKARPGMRSISVRIYCAEIVARWFERMPTPEARGAALARAMPKGTDESR